MKAIKIASMMLMAVVLMMSCSSDDEDNLQTDPPLEIQSFANKHFPENSIVEVKQASAQGKTVFETVLEGNIQLKFNENGDIIEIESETGIPDSLIPEKIRDYLSKFYPDNFIVEWELDDDHQEVELENGVELEFARDDQPAVDKDLMPDEIKVFLNEHFSDIKVINYIKEVSSTETKYEVDLAGDIELEFNSEMKITEMDSKNGLPQSVIPSKIWNYVTTNYSSQFIIGWELESNHQEVELNNELELEFTLDGEFVKAD